MNTKRIIAAVPLVLIMSLPFTAHAASNDWAGPYVGLNAGYAQDKNVTLDFPDGTSSNSFDMTGGYGGVQAGYNWAVGNMVLGLQADAAAADISGDGGCPGALSSCKAKMDQLYKIQGRVGFPINNFLLYASLGGASGQIEAKTVRPTGSFSDSNYQTGWLAGIGGAMAFNSHWNGLVEVQYIDFGSNDYSLGGNNVSVDNKFITVNIGANYRF